MDGVLQKGAGTFQAWLHDRAPSCLLVMTRTMHVCTHHDDALMPARDVHSL